jgi:hypothetical protein
MTVPQTAIDIATRNFKKPPVQMRPEVQAAYDRYAREHNGDLSNIPELCEYFVNVGFRMCLESMNVFNDLPGQLARVERQVQRIREVVDGMGT